jgi:hypothetical protein
MPIISNTSMVNSSALTRRSNVARKNAAVRNADAVRSAEAKSNAEAVRNVSRILNNEALRNVARNVKRLFNNQVKLNQEVLQESALPKKPTRYGNGSMMSKAYQSLPNMSGRFFGPNSVRRAFGKPANASAARKKAIEEAAEKAIEEAAEKAARNAPRARYYKENHNNENTNNENNNVHKQNIRPNSRGITYPPTEELNFSRVNNANRARYANESENGGTNRESVVSQNNENKLTNLELNKIKEILTKSGFIETKNKLNVLKNKKITNIKKIRRMLNREEEMKSPSGVRALYSNIQQNIQQNM